jgi:hypothetical protein
MGDFDGDKKPDVARLLKSTDGKAFGLFVFPGSGGKPMALEQSSETSLLEGMGIGSIKPGKYKTACGKGYFDCSGAEPKEIVLLNDAIDYFKTESANSYFVWEPKKKAFNRIWMSD